MRNTTLFLCGAAIMLAGCQNRADESGANDTTNVAVIDETAMRDGSNMMGNAGNMAGRVGDRVQDAAAGVVGMAGAPLVNDAASYVRAAAISDMYEIESSRLALEKGQSAQVKAFARQMIADHTATTKAMKAALADSGVNVTPPTALDSRRQGMIDNLRNLSGAAFDKAYLDQQTLAHQEALATHRSFADDGDNAALKRFAAATAPKVEQHHQKVQGLDEGGADGTR